MSGKRITDLEQVTSISDESSYPVETESGTRHIRHKDLVAGIEKALPIGDMEELKELKELENLEVQEEQPSVKEKLTLVKAILKVLGIATAVFKGTDGVKGGTAGMVPAPTANDKGKVLGANGKWVTHSGGEVAAQNVKFSDGSDAETNLGAIKGMTSDLNCENEDIAASAVGLKKVNDSLGGNNLIYNESEDAYYIRHGADSVLKKLGSDFRPVTMSSYLYVFANNVGVTNWNIGGTILPNIPVKCTITYRIADFTEGKNTTIKVIGSSGKVYGTINITENIPSTNLQFNTDGTESYIVFKLSNPVRMYFSLIFDNIKIEPI